MAAGRLQGVGVADRGRATAVMVAERAGVSIASVSRVLNGLTTSDDVRRNVLRAAAELDYVPDAVARSLKVGRTDQVALAVADVGNPVYVTMMHAIADVLGGAGYRLVISASGADPADQLGLLATLGRGYCRRPHPQPAADHDRAARRPRRQPPSRRRHRLAAARGRRRQRPRRLGRRASGSRSTTSSRTGRRRIAFVNGPVDTVPGAARLRGFLAARRRLGLATLADMQVESADFTYAAGVPAVEELLDQATPDAIMCANDLLAVAAINVLRRRGARVPDDVAVVGMDDTDIAELVQPVAHQRRPRRRPPRARPLPSCSSAASATIARRAARSPRHRRWRRAPHRSASGSG